VAVVEFFTAGVDFSAGDDAVARAWLPRPDWFATYAVAEQDTDAGSTPTLHRTASGCAASSPPGWEATCSGCPQRVTPTS
jgi:hypothetical protein